MMRYLLVGTLAATVTVFAWETVSNTVIPWHSAPMRQLGPDAVAAVHGALPGNGLYYAGQGILAIVNTTPDMRDRSKEMGVPIARQVVIVLVAMLLLAAVVARLPRRGALAGGLTLSLAATGVATLICVSNWNWYGYPFAFELANVADSAVQGFLAGAVLGWALRRFLPAGATSGARAVAAGA